MCNICLQLPQDAVLQKYSEMKAVFKNFAKIAGKHPCLALFHENCRPKIELFTTTFLRTVRAKNLYILCVHYTLYILAWDNKGQK